jgi:hypothetical protein
MIDRRRWPSATPASASTKVPLSSGPRWAIARHMAWTRAVASALEDAALASKRPAMPHTLPRTLQSICTFQVSTDADLGQAALPEMARTVSRIIRRVAVEGT